MAIKNWLKSLRFAEEKKVSTRPPMGVVKDAEGDSLDLFSSGLAVNPNTFYETEKRTLVEQCRIMENTDPYLYGLMMTRRIAITGLRRQVTGGEPKVLEFVQEALSKINGFSWILYQMLSAIPSGFSITEVIWALDPETGMIVAEDLKPRYQDKFLYSSDYRLKLITPNAPQGIELPERKFIELPYMSEYGNKYGQAVYQKIYWYWYFKKHSTKFWAMFTERFASPMIKAEIPSTATDEDKDLVLQFLRDAKNATSVHYPAGFKIELLEAQRSGSLNSYEGFLDFLNRGMAIAILGQTLTSDTQGTGSFAMAKVHNLVREDILRADVMFLESAINDYFIRWLVDYNFPDTVDYPKWEIVLDDDIDLKQYAEVLQILYDMGYDRIPLSWITKTFGIPVAEEGEDTLVKTAGVSFAEALSNLEKDVYLEALKKVR